jgi:hypothetical protein
MRQHCGLPRACWHQECEVSASATAINFHSIYPLPIQNALEACVESRCM